MSDCFLGEIRMFAGSYNPENWIFCDGQSLNVNQYEALFSLIGTTYGGDGVTTFKVPDFKGRVPVGQGTNTTTNPPLTPRVIGQSGGEEYHTLTAAEMPAHTHAVYACNSPATAIVPGPSTLYGTVQPNATAGITGLYTTVPSTTLAGVAFDVKAVGAEGGSQPHANVMTTTAISFIMAIMGNYPTRTN